MYNNSPVLVHSQWHTHPPQWCWWPTCSSTQTLVKGYPCCHPTTSPQTRTVTIRFFTIETTYFLVLYLGTKMVAVKYAWVVSHFYNHSSFIFQCAHSNHYYSYFYYCLYNIIINLVQNSEYDGTQHLWGRVGIPSFWLQIVSLSLILFIMPDDLTTRLWNALRAS